MVTEHFVLSAHGSADSRENFLFTIPHNIRLVTYDRFDTCTEYGTTDPNSICNGTFTRRHVVERFEGGQTFPNFLLWGDGGKQSNRSPYVVPEFHSGVKRCSDNAIVINIDQMHIIVNMEKRWRYKTTLEQVVTDVSRFHVSSGNLAEIHLLICLGQVHDSTLTTLLTEKMGVFSVGGRRRKSIKMQQRKKNRSSKSKSKSKHNRRHKSKR